MRRARASRGFTLLELMITLAIFGTALLALSAASTGAFASVGDSINQRAAREVCRSKLEQAIATQEQNGGGPVDNYPGFQWSLSSQEQLTGASDSQTEKFIILTATVTFPQDNPPPQMPGAPTTGASAGGTITLMAIVDPPDLVNGQSPTTGTTGSPSAAATGESRGTDMKLAPRLARRNRGFTLLELLIALAITALIMGMIAGVLVDTLDKQERVENKLATEKTGYGILSLVRRDLEACYAYGLGSLAFKGERGSDGDRVQFVTASEAAPDPKTGIRPRFQMVGYRGKSDQNNVLSLYRRADPYTGGDPLQDGTYTQVASGIKAFQLSYLDPKDKNWKDSAWTNTDRLPLAVKVSVDLVPDPSTANASTTFSSDQTAPHYETVVGIAAGLSPVPDPSPAPGQPGQPGQPNPPPPNP